jgi:hypothetical protein
MKLRRFGRKKTPPKLQAIKAFFILAFYKSGFKGLFTKMPLALFSFKKTQKNLYIESLDVCIEH